MYLLMTGSSSSSVSSSFMRFPFLLLLITLADGLGARPALVFWIGGGNGSEGVEGLEPNVSLSLGAPLEGVGVPALAEGERP